MNPLAAELNSILSSSNPHVYEMLSRVGQRLFFPKGILSQSAEAREKAHKINATIGIAKQDGHTMHLSKVMDLITGLRPSQSLTYAPSFGIPALRQRWQKDLVAKNPSLSGKAISLPVVTCGITNAVSVFSEMWVDPEDVIILPSMMWGNYNMIFTVRNQGRMVHYELFGPGGGFNVEGFRKVVEEEARRCGKIVVLLNFPHNPTGYAPTLREAEEIASILRKVAQDGCNVLAVMDDSYFGLFYEDDTFKESLFALLAGADPRLLAVKLDGATKEYFVWGFRVGFITYGGLFEDELGYDALEEKTAGCVRGNISNASHLSQSLLLKCIEDPGTAHEMEEKFSILKGRAMEVKNVLADPKYGDAFEPYPFNSGYFMCLRLKTVDAEALRVHLLERFGVGLVALGSDKLRVAYSCIEQEQVGELIDIILQGVRNLETGPSWQNLKPHSERLP